MDREIKFRAFQKDMNMVIYPKKHYSPTYELWYLGEMYNPEENEFHIMRERDSKFVLMQYTWLKDKNWQEIYEGDVMQDGRFVDTDYGSFVLSKWKGEHATVQYFPDIIKYDMKLFKELEVVWNIYENPELLA